MKMAVRVVGALGVAALLTAVASAASREAWAQLATTAQCQMQVAPGASGCS